MFTCPLNNNKLNFFEVTVIPPPASAPNGLPSITWNRKALNANGEVVIAPCN